MHIVRFVLVACLLASPLAAAENPVTNGSFEKLGPNGFPVDWGAVGQTVGVSDDAHTGKRSLRMARSAETKTPETGLNREWRPDSGERGAMIDRLKGGIAFWYKAISADDARLTVQAIPMDKTPIEKTGSPRVIFPVPTEHIGDGQWHHGRVAYDFTENEKAKWVHFSARILGKAGELLLDDVSYVAKVGPLLAIRAVHFVEDAEQPGRRCTVKVSVKNTGDEVARDVRVTLTPPPGLKATPASVSVGHLPPRGAAWARVRLDGERNQAMTIPIKAASGQITTHAAPKIAPQLVLESFGPTSPVAEVGKETTVECVVRNPGGAAAVQLTAEFKLPTGTVTRTAKSLAPGQRRVLKASFVPKEQVPALGASVRVRAGNVEGELTRETSLVVAAPALVPPPQPEGVAIGQVAATDDLAFLGNEHLCLTFRRSDFGFGPGCLFVRKASGWRRVAWLPRLSRLIYWTPDGKRRQHMAFATERPEVARMGRTLRLRFRWTLKDEQGATWTLDAYFELTRGEKAILADYQLTCDQPRQLLAFDGPMLYALDRDEAVFPGLEWLVDDEMSSSTLDIAEDHTHQKRFVVHPNLVTIPAIGVHGKHGTVGLLWDVHQEWDGEQGKGTGARPAVLFASPDRLSNQRAHLMGLFLPSVPDYVVPNTTEAAMPYPLKAGQTLRLRCRIFADGAATDALAAVDEWFRRRGWPEPMPLPHRTYEREIEFSMQAYLTSLWEPETSEWWSSKGGNPKMCKLGRQRAYLTDLLVGEILSPDEPVRRAARARALEVHALIGGELRMDAQRFGARADLAYANLGPVASLINSVGKDGAWRFNAERPGTGVFEAVDYHVLGPHNAVEVGTCARNAFVALRYARITGERRAYDAMQKTLELMETFRVPRAAQVWEVPVHTPDILAAADAVDAYIEAYRFSGEERWLRDAVVWARRGLPFVYFWGLPEKPYLLGASIPVFGATFHRGSWFGRPVQWNGLRYANAVLKLAEYDRSRPWRRIAELIIRSAIHQQDLEGENVALWPDNINAIDDKKCPWVFAPRQIIRNILKLTGRDEDPATVIVGTLPRRVHLTAAAEIADVAWDGSRLGFRVTYPSGEQGVVLVSNVSRPIAVRIAGKPIAERREIEKGDEPGWRYDIGGAFLCIRIARDGQSAVQVEGARFRGVERLPEAMDRIAFAFDDSAEGWVAAHDIGQLTVRDGAVHGEVTGGDPYLVRHSLRAKAADYPVLVIRMRLTAGPGCQFFFATDASPALTEDKSLRFTAKADGKFHDYRLPVGAHGAWKGTITAIRIDTGSGVGSGEFAIDSVRGAKE